MKVSLNERTTERVIALLSCFPEGTKMTHVINVALNDLYNKINPKNEENAHEESRTQTNIK